MPLYRVSRWLHIRGVPLVPTLITLWIRFFWGAFIPCSADIGAGTRVGYGGMGTVIHKHARIGRDCLIAHNVTIGGTGTCEGVPVIGDRVHAGTGAVILGPITIGDDVVIGANAVVLSDVAAGQVVVGVPARVVQQKSSSVESKW